MKNLSRGIGRGLLTAALVGSLVACGAQPETTDTTDAQPTQTETKTSEVVSREDVAPDAGGRIDVTQTGDQVATFDGSKYITSDATADQTQGTDLGLQEICVVSQPAAWADIESIGWDRNSITYNNIATDWGSESFRFEYINEAGSAARDASWSRTTEQGFFGEDAEVSHVTLSGHDVAYVLNNDAAYEIGMGISDLEAKAQTDALAESHSFVTLHAWEKRADDCAFAVNVSCDVNKDSGTELDAEQLLNDAYGALEFVEGGGTVDAASYQADLSIDNADGSRHVTIKRNGDSLLGYTRHSATLSSAGNGASFGMLLYDFAPEGGLEALEETTASLDKFNPEYGYTDVSASDVEQHEVDGRTVYARVVSATLDMGPEKQIVSRELRAWCDLNGDALYVETGMVEDEDVETALARALKGRIEVA